MRLLVIVEEPEAYEKWKASQESWLKQNPDYLKRVPAELREVAMINAGIPMETKVSDQAAATTPSTVSLN
jgi:cytochrome c oxidase subunit 2